MPIHIDQMAQEFQVPWKHKYVEISKKTHSVKSWHARVIDAIQPINPSSKPTLMVQYECISPSSPWQDQLSYDNIVDAVYVSRIPPCQRMLTICRTYRKLYTHFHKEHAFYFEMSLADVPMLAPNNGSVTSAWSPSSFDMSLSPTWNPSLRTPLIVDSGNKAPITSMSTYPQHVSAAVPVTVMLSPAHPLLDPHLIRKAARAKVSDRLHPKPDATMSISAGQNNNVAIQQWWHNQSFYLKPEWVTLWHLSPTHDNGLLLVIRGDHYGKYVHHIHHYYNDDSHPIMQLAVVEHRDGAADPLTEEQIKLCPEDLCQGFETESEKKLNTNLMIFLCKQA
jgi:hypothetical protein